MGIHSSVIVQINIKSSLISHGLNLLHIMTDPLLPDALRLADSLFVDDFSIVQGAGLVVSHVGGMLVFALYVLGALAVDQHSVVVELQLPIELFLLLGLRPVLGQRLLVDVELDRPRGFDHKVQ